MMVDSLGAIAQLEALRTQREVNQVLGILTGEIDTKARLGGYAPEEILGKYLFEVVDIYPRDRLIEMRRKNIFVRIFYDNTGEVFEVEISSRKIAGLVT